MKKNEVIEFTIHDLTVDGAGVGRSQDVVVFVAGALPGEHVRAKIIKVAKKYCVARLEEILSPSPFRITPPCPYFKQCGGCSLMFMNQEGQLLYKQNYVQNCLERIGGVSLDVEPIKPSPKELHYRNKVSLPFGFRDGQAILGFYKPKSHDIVPISRCLLQEHSDEGMNAVLSFVREKAIAVYDEGTGTGLLRHLIIRTNQQGEAMVGLVINGKEFPWADELAAFLKQKINLKTLVINQNTKNTNAILGDVSYPVFGEGVLAETLFDKRFHISLNSFFQINTPQTQNLYAKAYEYAQITPEDRVLDLYCGTGTIGLCTAHKAKELLGVEIVERAVADAKTNAAMNEIENARFLCCETGLLKEGQSFDVVFVDPPRRGLDLSTIELLKKSAPQRLVYISCDPATLCRDVSLLTDCFEPKACAPFDLFPQTTHVETVMLLVKRSICG